jgi:methyl-accepting chemotaxis protein
MEIVSAVKEVAIILFVIAAIILCTAVTVGIIKLFPSFRRTQHNLEKTTAATGKIAEDFATVSESVASNLAETAGNAMTMSVNVAKTTGDFARVSDDVAQNIAATAHNATESSKHILEATENIAAIASLDVRGIAIAFARGNIKSLRDMAQFVGERGWSLARSFVRRGSG